MATQKNSLKLRRPLRLTKKWGLATLALALIGVAGYYGYQYRGDISVRTENFVAKAIDAKLEHVLVEGTKFTDPDSLHVAIGMQKGDSLVGVDVAKIRERIEALDWVKLATVTRNLPSTLKIEVYEHHPLAKIDIGGEVWVINKKGKQITRSDERFEGLPMLTGTKAAVHAADLFMLLSQEVELLEALKAATYVGERRWDLGFKSGVRVQLPEIDSQHALKVLVALDDERKVLAKEHGTVDLRIADRVILRDMAE